MDINEFVESKIRESIEAKKDFISQSGNISKASEIIAECFQKGGKVLVFGNGGSAADSQHIAGELVAKFMLERKGLPVIALTNDTSILTAWSNDYNDGFQNVFARETASARNKVTFSLDIEHQGKGQVFKLSSE